MERRTMETGTYFSHPGGMAAPIIPIEFLPEPPPPEIIIIERPIYIPENAPGQALPPSVRGQEAVRQANAQGIIQPSDFSHAAMVYDYHPDWVYQIYTQPLRVTDIRLEAGETVVGNAFVSDSERWSLGAGVSYENGIPVQHIYVRPDQASVQASLIINTNRRVYHLILKSFRDVYMPMVRWRYPSTGLPNNFISLPSRSGVSAPWSYPGDSSDLAGINLDPRFLSFDYRVTHSWLRRPRWFPELVFDDGRQTYIVFPVGVLQLSLPAIFDDRRNVVNYRVFEHVIILDRLVEKITMRLDSRQVVIEKKRR
jgi:type IV secretion system protein VirB9